MKKTGLILLFFTSLVLVACDRDDEDEVSERFLLLTSTVWVSDQLLVNGVDASEGVLASFRGEAIFEVDGTGSFGQFTGTWEFMENETKLRITPQGFIVIIADIVRLTTDTLEIVTGYPNPLDPAEILDVRMIFNAQ